MKTNRISMGLIGLVFLAGLGLPFITNAYYDHLLVMALIYAILAISFNLYLGFLGGLTLAHSAFFGLGGYVTGLITVKAHWPAGMGLMLAIVICAAAALILGFAALRLKGAYFVLITVAFLGILGGLSNTLNDLTGGSSGLNNIPSLAIGFGDTVGADDEIKLDRIWHYEHTLDTVEFYEDEWNRITADGQQSDALYFETLLDSNIKHYRDQLQEGRLHYLAKTDETRSDKTSAYLSRQLADLEKRYQAKIDAAHAGIPDHPAAISQADIQDYIAAQLRETLAFIRDNYNTSLDAIDLSGSVDQIKQDYVADLDHVQADTLDPSGIRLYRRLGDEAPGDPTRDAFYKTGIHFQTEMSFYLLALFFLTAVFIITYRLVNSRIGRSFVAVRDIEELANSLGINPFKYKMIGFVATAVLAAVAGWLYAHYWNIMDPRVFGFDIMFDVVFMVIIGGTGTLIGPVVGAFFVQLVPELITDHIVSVDDEWRTAFLALLMLIVIIMVPTGIYGYAKMQWKSYRSDQKTGSPEDESPSFKKWSRSLKAILSKYHLG